MANKRELKKSLEALSSALVNEMMASYYNSQDADREKINDAIRTIADAMVKAKHDTNVLFDKGVKDFDSLADYNKAKSEFTKKKYADAIAGYNEALEKALKAYNEAMPKNEVGGK